jgi:predicted  nucleic acid-binding Zn-ribbon protein
MLNKILGLKERLERKRLERLERARAGTPPSASAQAAQSAPIIVTDLASAHARIAQLRVENAGKQAERDCLAKEKARLESELAQAQSEIAAALARKAKAESDALKQIAEINAGTNPRAMARVSHVTAAAGFGPIIFQEAKPQAEGTGINRMRVAIAKQIAANKN